MVALMKMFCYHDITVSTLSCIGIQHTTLMLDDSAYQLVNFYLGQRQEVMFLPHVSMEGKLRISKGRVFQMVGVATTKLREPKHVRTRSTDSKLESDERKLRDGT